MSGEAPGGEGKTCPGCGGLGWIPAGDEQLGCIDCNGTGHAPAPPSTAVAEGPLPEVPPAATEADALIRLAYDARFGGHEWQRRAHSYLWRDPKPSPAAADAVEEALSALSLLAAEPAKVSGSVSIVRSDDPPAKPLPTCVNCGSNFITPAAPPSDAVREAAEVVRTILTAHDARLSESGVLTYGPPSKGTGFVAAIQWLRRYDAARGGE